MSGEAEDKFEVEIEDDTPEQDRGKPRRAEGTEPEIPDDSELESYSEGVQKRIKKLKFEYHEERRRKEEAERIKEEAIKFAEAQKRELDAMRARYAQNETAFVGEAKARVDVELERARAAYKTAYESGDVDAVTSAQEKIMELKAQKMRLDEYRPAPQQPPQAQQPKTPPIPEPDPRAKQWLENNSWFGHKPGVNDLEMTALALGVHENLKNSGVAVGSEKYYAEIDAAVRRRFPERFGEEEVEVKAPSRQTGSVVAPASRSVPTSRDKVRITASAAALAKRLGLTNEQYAAQVLKERNNG
jgi:hypothetical protein